ncbi:hypothetical protein [Streptomyces sp. NPDC014734]|uniref:hypothetical protein n=1 Tax=Streptomyces sp. NPDC014734 TaxID=3364886 RepID=UPI0036FCB517
MLTDSASNPVGACGAQEIPEHRAAHADPHRAMCGDPRWPAFADHYGLDPAHPVQGEVEALEPAELQCLVLAAVDLYIDHTVLARQITREEQQRRALTTS